MYVTAGLTLVGAGALIGSFIAPTPSNFDATRVQLASTQHDAPAPDGGGLATDAYTVQCASGDTSTALFGRIGAVADSVQRRLVGPDAFVAVSSQVVTHVITTPKTGAALTNSALTSAVLNKTAELKASGAMPDSMAAAIRALVDTLSSVTSTSSGATAASTPLGSAGAVPGSDTGTGSGVGIGGALNRGILSPDTGIPSPDTGGDVESLAAVSGGPVDVGQSSFFAVPAVQFPTTATASGGGGGGGGGPLIGSVPNAPSLPNADLTALLMLWRDRFRDFPGTPGSPDLGDLAVLVSLLHAHFPDLDMADFFAHLHGGFGDVGDSLSDHGLADFFAHLRDMFGDHLGSSGGMSDDDVAAFFAHLHDVFGVGFGSSGMSDVELKDFFARLHVGLGGVGDSLSNHGLADLFAHLHDEFGVGLGSSGGMSDDELKDFFAHLHVGFGGVGDSSSNHELVDLHDKFGDGNDSSDLRDHGLPDFGTIRVGDSIGAPLAGGHLVSEESRVAQHDDFHESVSRVEVDNNTPRHALPDSFESEQQDQQTPTLPNRPQRELQSNPEPSLDVGLQIGPRNGPRVAISESSSVGYTPKHSRETQTGVAQSSQEGSTGSLSQPRHAKPSQSESHPAAANRHVSNSSAGSTGHRKGG